MATPNRLHRDSVALLTDFYQLTMAHGFWKSGATVAFPERRGPRNRSCDRRPRAGDGTATGRPWRFRRVVLGFSG